MKRLTRFCILFYCLLIVIPTNKILAQHQTADSIVTIIENNLSDTIAFVELNKIIGSLFYQDADMAMVYAIKELDLAKKANYNYARGKALLNIGIIPIMFQND